MPKAAVTGSVTPAPRASVATGGVASWAVTDRCRAAMFPLPAVSTTASAATSMVTAPTKFGSGVTVAV